MSRKCNVPKANWLDRKHVDDHPLSFDELSSVKIPELLDKLGLQLDKPLDLDLFDREGLGIAGIRKHKEFKAHTKPVKAALVKATKHSMEHLKKSDKRVNQHDFAGVYVMATEEGLPFYVGISRSVIRRLCCHVASDKHTTASLAYLMAADLVGHTGKREELDLNSPKARQVRNWLKKQQVAILPVASPVERYLLEIAAALSYETGGWNSFETH